MSTTGMGAGGSAGGPDFTAEMRDRQARGRDPYNTRESWSNMGNMRGGGGASSSSSGWKTGPRGHLSSKDNHMAQERRAIAAAVLDSPELLMMHAQSTGDSIPATRLRFTRMLCGYEDVLEARTGANPGSSSVGKKSGGSSRRIDGKWQPN